MSCVVSRCVLLHHIPTHLGQVVSKTYQVLHVDVAHSPHERRIEPQVVPQCTRRGDPRGLVGRRAEVRTAHPVDALGVHTHVPQAVGEALEAQEGVDAVVWGQEPGLGVPVHDLRRVQATLKLREKRGNELRVDVLGVSSRPQLGHRSHNSAHQRAGGSGHKFGAVCFRRVIVACVAAGLLVGTAIMCARSTDLPCDHLLQRRDKARNGFANKEDVCVLHVPCHPARMHSLARNGGAGGRRGGHGAKPSCSFGGQHKAIENGGPSLPRSHP
mmetsp:Transcript_4318/g.10506  ORF Transcript_4318/g.10506 Transcript_4318/m.10506 type:complete len:271 (-) Transcript_4318:159-971(-)